jgi:NADH:ubiquinone oxidoreductase subunit F (NADH-binding)
MLARSSGGAEGIKSIFRDNPVHPVYCLGYCDRSPVAMTPEGKVVPNLSAASAPFFNASVTPPLPAPPSIRCTARHSIVTARLLNPTPIDPAPSYDGLRAALNLAPDKVIEAISAAGVRGRGGAAYPTGRKWQLAAAATGSPKFIVANGDEGDPGSFIDRELMERDPHGILEGMAIAAHAVGASRGIVFIRSEYPVASDVMTRAIAAATRNGSLGPDALGINKPFDVEVVRGMGSYVCGEETALLAAIEGQRGEVWPRPPYPVEAGLFGKPTVVDNVETLANMPWIMLHGAPAYAAMGTADSKGTKALCFNHGFANPGIVEIEFGMTLRDAIDTLGGGGRNGVPLEAILLGGPMGSIVTPDQWDAPLCFAGMARRGINLGHAGLVAIPKSANWAAILRHLLTFMRDESCGKCVPCRLGTIRAHELASDGLTRADLPRFERIMELMKVASLCAFGRETPGPIRTILEKFGDQVIASAEAKR